MCANRKECSVCQWNTHRFGLCSGNIWRAEKTAMDTLRLKSVVTKRACTVGKCERHDHEIATFNRANIRADVFYHAYGFVPHHATGGAVLHLLVWPQIAPANAR